MRPGDYDYEGVFVYRRPDGHYGVIEALDYKNACAYLPSRSSVRLFRGWRWWLFFHAQFDSQQFKHAVHEGVTSDAELRDWIRQRGGPKAVPDSPFSAPAATNRRARR